MSKDMLSQDEIDALLKANNMSEETDAGGETDTIADVSDFLTPFEQDALGEIGNISFGSAATALSTLLNQKVDITTPTVSLVKRSKLAEEFPRPHVVIHVEYVDGFSGINLLVIKMDDAAVIADLMMGGTGKPENTDLTDLHISAVQEAMNQMMGSAATSMSTIFNKLVNISPPGIDIIDLAKGKGDENIPDDDYLIKVSFRINVGDNGELIDSTIMQLLPVHFARQMVDMLMGGDEAAATGTVELDTADTLAASPAAPEAPQPQMAPPEPPAAEPAAAQGYYEQPPMTPPPGYQPPYQPPYQQPYQQPPYQQPPYQQPMMHQMPHQFGGPSTYAPQPANVKPAEFGQFQHGNMFPSDDQNLGLLLDIPLQVTVELGRTKKLIKDILDLQPGSIIELDKLAGEPVDILVNNKLIAKGEVVVIDENFGVRVTEIISQWDRVQKLQ